MELCSFVCASVYFFCGSLVILQYPSPFQLTKRFSFLAHFYQILSAVSTIILARVIHNTTSVMVDLSAHIWSTIDVQNSNIAKNCIEMFLINNPIAQIVFFLYKVLCIHSTEMLTAWALWCIVTPVFYYGTVVLVNHFFTDPRFRLN